ncbi:major capsid protein [Mycolicibacterium fortuitum]|uniref:Major capsid protein n=2 Tax=Mycolicibacterium fortuitum TaxID=1766 RepID=A0AAE5AFF8_MYCFO|nr:major capsid protein [Mycolicibacterium fortuitum]MCV7139800.1 major capsid protein [Mycolicibacterium fortuitum]MDV7194800.1 major capsid protein [Mycolicibacterium fortuitum]MDV7207703.1 major capsid protein [Mycolicibacterium fortuitum]MDV7229759.1 major capsid protein [Mycolicibacterium fortuitum]MDV7261488.1 major capsid protein [Mycolicibacterium fortuitum]
MAIVFDGPIGLRPDAITTFIRTVPIPASNLLQTLFPTRYFDSNRIDWAELVQTNRTAAYRSFDGTIHVSARDAGSGKYVELIPFSDSLNKGEYERIAEEIALNAGTNTERLVRAAYNDAERLMGTMNNRIELAWGDVLTDGKLTINNEGGFSGEADYGVPANQITAPAGALWTDANQATAVPLTDLDAWQEVRIANGKSRAGKMLMSRTRRSVLRRNKQIIDAVYGSTAGRTSVTVDELNRLLESEELPQIVTYDAMLNVEGTDTRVFATDKVALIPDDPAQLGFMAFGLSATALELVKSNKAEMTFGNASGVVGLVEKVGPPYREFTFVDAVGMPILSDAGLLTVADVA